MTVENASWDEGLSRKGSTAHSLSQSSGEHLLEDYEGQREQECRCAG